MEPWKKGYRQYLQPIIAFPFRTYPQILWSIFFHIFIFSYTYITHSLRALMYIFYIQICSVKKKHTQKKHTQRDFLVCVFLWTRLGSCFFLWFYGKKEYSCNNQCKSYIVYEIQMGMEPKNGNHSGGNRLHRCQ